MTKKKPVSPASSGGAGTRFEYRVAAIAYSYLLAGAHPPGLTVPIVGVGLQQRVQGHLLDDIVMTAEPGPDPLCVEYQAKLTLTVTAGDAEFVSVVTQGLHQIQERAEEVARGDLELGLIARGDQAALEQLGELATFAQGHTADETFANVFIPGVVKEPVRDRLVEVRKAVGKAIADGAPDLGGVDVSTHALLSVLHVWRVSDGDGGADFRAALDLLVPAAESFGVNPIDVFGHLTALAQGWGVVAGVVDASTVRRQLRRRGLALRRISVNGTTDQDDVDTDAVVRGPVAALELEDALDQAEQALAVSDPSAAELFADIAARLEAKGFRPHAVIMRRREADARQQVGRSDDAVLARARLAWDHLDAVQPWEAGFALNDGRRTGAPEQVSAAANRVSQTADAAVWVAMGSDVDGLLAAFDVLEIGDPHHERAAAFLCEEAIAAARPAIVLDRREVLESIARTAATASDTVTRRCGARIQMCVADATGEWSLLLLEINRRYDRSTVAWAYARYGRHLALTGDGAGAQGQYLTAIERACSAKMFDEAADWLYALRTVRFWYSDFDKDDQHPRAQVLRPYAKPSRLPGSPHTAEHALRAMLDDDKPREALQRLQRWRWQAVVRAHLTEETDAVESLGVLLQRHDKAQGAVECFARAGAVDQAAAVDFPSDAVAHLSLEMLAPVEACRATAFAAVAAAADQITDDDGRAWAEAALAEAKKDHRDRLVGPSARLRAFDALAELCDCLSGEQLDELIMLVDPLIDRAAGHYRQTDKAVTKILVSIAGKRDDAVHLLVRALLADERMGDIVLSKAQDILKAHKIVISALLAPHASSHRNACLALIIAGADTAPTRDFAEKQVGQELAARDHQPGQITYYVGAAEFAIFASVLDMDTRKQVARTLLERSLDRREATFSRRDSLKGLLNIVRHIDEEARTALFPSLLEMARGEHDGGPADDVVGGAASPFEMVTIKTGSSTLTDLALECATRLAADDSQRETIAQIGIALLRSSDEPGQWRISSALASMPTLPRGLNLNQCAAHPSPALRALAAVRWAKDPAALPQAMAVQLARDEEHEVRQVLARALLERRDTATIDEATRIVTDILKADVRRSVRTYIFNFRPGSH